MSITFCYVVGGNDSHYYNLDLSLRSIRKHIPNAKFWIMEINQNKINSNKDKTMSLYKEYFDFKTNEKIGFHFWKNKYKIVQFPTTDYICYLDTDMIMAQNNIDEICHRIGYKIGVAQHFWCPRVSDFENNAILPSMMEDYKKVKKEFGIENNDAFFAGGSFIFKNSISNKNIMQTIFEKCAQMYENNAYKSGSGLTDELILSNVLNKESSYVLLGGAYNHCCMGNEFMELQLENKELFGKNRFETEWKPVTFIHCDINRRLPYVNYSPEINKFIENIYGEL